MEYHSGTIVLMSLSLVDALKTPANQGLFIDIFNRISGLKITSDNLVEIILSNRTDLTYTLFIMDEFEDIFHVTHHTLVTLWNECHPNIPYPCSDRMSNKLKEVRNELFPEVKETGVIATIQRNISILSTLVAETLARTEPAVKTQPVGIGAWRKVYGRLTRHYTQMAQVDRFIAVWNWLRNDDQRQELPDFTCPEDILFYFFVERQDLLPYFKTTICNDVMLVPFGMTEEDLP